MLVSSHLSPRTEQLWLFFLWSLTTSWTQSQSHFSHRSAQSCPEGLFGLVGVELRDASTVTTHDAFPTVLSMNLSALCTETDAKYSAFFWGLLCRLQSRTGGKSFISELFCYAGEGCYFLCLQLRSSPYTVGWIFLLIQWAQLQNMLELMKGIRKQMERLILTNTITKPEKCQGKERDLPEQVDSDALVVYGESSPKVSLPEVFKTF